MTRRTRSAVALLALALSPLASAAGQAARTTPRPLRPGDYYQIKRVGDPQVSPEGDWVAYVLSTSDSAKDKNDSDIWMTRWDGTRSIRLTNSPEGESHPRWSPDGRYLAFGSSRQGAKGGQVWLLDRAGGEAEKLTDIKGGVDDWSWSPDGKRLALVLKDPDPDEADSTAKKSPKPMVMDRYKFKEDVQGYLMNRRTHLYLFDVATKKLDTLTRGAFDDERPVWSPDGTKLLFLSNRRPEGDRTDQHDLFVIEARAGAEARQLTTFEGIDAHPARSAWSPDGKFIAYLTGRDFPVFAYDQSRLAVIPAEGGTPRILTDKLDRGVREPAWTDDGASIRVLVTDDREDYVATVDVATGTLARVTKERNVVSSVAPGPHGRWAALASDPATPAELFAIDQGELRRLTHHNDAWLAGIELGAVEGFASKGKDGAESHGIVIRPPASVAAGGKPLPAILFIHGGPKGQDGFGFDLTRQMLAAKGFVVAGVNYRGSDGRGHAWQKAIYADWGNKEVVDILGAADYLVAKGIADGSRLGIGGWSYGGILTDYTTATDTRFKVASSGAGSALQTSMYGTDQYIVQYDNELGAPWKNPQLWMKLSYPFFKADKIKTPTLYMSGEKDFNVPTSGSEQMYQALKSAGTEAQLVVYPSQFHGLTVPSYLVDRFTRWQQWFDARLGAPAPAIP
jgi:dipeptidyl aminopeptidase/acylaminoacyl peptidase